MAGAEQASRKGLLTRREHVVLALVGRRLTNAEIAAELVISTRTVESHVAALRRKLNADSRLQLVEAAGRIRGPGPATSTTFVGRSADLQRLGEQLGRHGWVAVVGVPGCGKSRFVAEYVASVGGPAAVADLARSTASSVLLDVAAALGIGADSRPVDAVAVALRRAALGEPTLLVLDNVDRVVPAVSALVRALAARGVDSRILTTSRVGVVAAPYELVLEPLTMSAAVELFVDRAAGADRVVEARDAGQVVALLDGLPLAIELAARRLRHVSLDELAAGLRAGPDRGLVTAIDGSWTLLDAEQRACLTRLAAVPGDLDRRTAALAGVGDAELGDLLDRSLLAVRSRPAAGEHGETIFTLLGAVRSFVHTHGDPELAAEVRRDHAYAHAALAADLELRARTDDSPAAVEEARRLAPDLVAALDWSLGRDPARALALARALAACAEQHGADLVSLAAVGRAAEDPEVRRLAGPVDLVVLGEALCFGDLRLLCDLARLALAKLDGRDPDEHAAGRQDVLAAHHLAALAAAYTDDVPAALEHLELADRIAGEVGSAWQQASLSQVRGIALHLGTGAELDQALTALVTARDGYARAGDAMHVNNCRYMMASVAATARTRLSEAIGWAAQCADYALERGNRHELAHARLTSARLTAAQGEALPESVLSDLRACVETFTQVGDLRCLHRSCQLLGTAGPESERRDWLQQALEVARAARDLAHQAVALTALVAVFGATGDRRSLFLGLGELEAIVGAEEAATTLPDAYLPDLAEWSPVVAEGRARGSRWAASSGR